MKPIVTLTLNPTIDGASETDRVRPVHKIRTTNERYYLAAAG
jgi:6-phosphofructokinase 2